jgi:MFS family permease
LRKIDLVLIPMLLVAYGIQFLDKVVLGYSATYGLIADLGLVGQQYSWSSSIFYFGYLFWEYFGIYLLRYFPAPRYLGVIMILWSVVTMLISTTTNFAGLAAIRFILGMLESVVAPSFLLIVAGWYKRSEQPIRQVMWFLGTPVFGFIGALVSYGLGHVTDTSVPPWKLLFLVLGSLGILVGVVLFFFLPSSPREAWFLNEDEKQLAQARLAGDSITISHNWKWYQVREAFCDPKTYFFFLIALVGALPGGGLSNFQTLLLETLVANKSPLYATLMTLPGFSVEIVSMVLCGFIATKIENTALYIMSFCCVPAVIGTALVHALPKSNTWGRIIGLWLIYAQASTLSVSFSVISKNVSGYSKKSTVAAVTFVGYCVGSIAAPQFFKSSQSKTGYPEGIVMMLITLCIVLVLPLGLRAYLMWENRRRDKARLPGEDFSETFVLADETDFEIKGFRYKL